MGGKRLARRPLAETVRLVAADREHPLHRRAVGADHLVVEVPGAYREGLAGVEVVPRVGRRVAGQAEEPLVHHRQRVGHGPAGRFAHAQRGRRLRRQDLRDLEDGLEPRLRVHHLDRGDAVEPDRQVVRCLRVGLEKRHVRVDVGRHLRRGGEGVPRLLPLRLDPLGAQDPRARLEAHEAAPLARGGDPEGHRLPGRVLRLVGREGEDARPAASLLLPAPGPARPVDVDDLPGAVAARPVGGGEQVATPLRVLDLELPGAGAVRHLHHRGLQRRVDVRVGPRGEVFLAPLPPPAPVHLVQLHLHLAVAARRPVGVHQGHVDPVLGVGEDHPARLVALRGAQAHVALVGGVRDAEAVDAEGPARLEDAGREVGPQLARRHRLRRDRGVHPGLARLVEAALEDLLALGLVLPRGVVEDVLLEALERGASGARGRARRRP